ncbi:MAG: Sapep family Mn(2+)-dependent dipeptidase [Bulleidia sp.]|nr:Sapep family Mn(2+)-dependent dipeptidase [Bulleidia sp.]
MDFRAYWNAHQEEFRDLIRIPSVFDETSVCEETPYGAQVDNALQFMKQKCEQAGITTRLWNHDVLTASIGTGTRIDIVSHLDVVPPGSGWHTDPFDPQIRDGWIYGRGSQDMKSGAWLVFLALCILQEEGIPLHHEYRLVYGSDEERTMEPMREYVRDAGYPVFSFTPDGCFPLVIGEKGALTWHVEMKAHPGNILDLKGGSQENVIPEDAECLVKGTDEETVRNYMHEHGMNGTAVMEGSAVRIHVKGKSGHASDPDAGHNAIIDLLAILKDVLKNEDAENLFHAFHDPYGYGMHMDCEKKPLGKLTINLGTLELRDGKWIMECDCRYPDCIDAETLTDRLQAFFPDAGITLPFCTEPTLIEEDDPWLKPFEEAYEECVHKPCRHLVSGGVSYTKIMKRCVNFGAMPEACESLAHQADEKVCIDWCIQALEIYVKLLEKMDQMSC